MSWLASLKRLFGAGSAPGRRYIVDAAPLHSAGRSGERLGPREQVQVLQQLARFAEREKILLQAVFEGRALREVGHGENFGPVQVFFAENAEALPDVVLDLYKRNRGAVVISAHPQVEKRVAGMGGALLRPATFRKVLENGGGGESRPFMRRRRRPRGGGGDRGGQPEPGGAEAPAAGGPAAPAEPSRDSVRDLIDLVE